ncbi:MAG TPA: MG2 domain-containing protein, partial [Polyangia bacterium]|nr:MG2 domain-containing protein [Polyangia bacterium]
WQDDIQTWQFQLGEAHAPADRLRGFIHTDRGLYRPGELVHVKGLVRAVVAGEGLRVPKEKSALLVITDAHTDTQLRKTVAISAFGGFSVDLPISSEARLGDWSVAATVGQGAEQVRFADHFSVEEYRPVSFEVALKPARAAYELGQRPKIDLKASYLYGAPLSHGHVAFSVRRRDHVPSFAAFAGWSFADLNALEDSGAWWARYGERSYSELVTESEAELDGNGAATLRFATTDPQHELKTAQDYLVEANVSDDSHQTISKSVMVVAHRSPFYLGLHAKELMPLVGKPFAFEAIAVDDDGKPRPAEATLVVAHRSWECGWESATTFSGGYTCKKNDVELERRQVALGTTATSLPITVARSGQTLVTLRAPDGHGHEVVTSDYVYALGGGEADWRQSDDLKIPLVASQPRYRPGDTARLVAQANLKGAAMLVTVEREGVLSHDVRTFASSGDAIELPITDAYAPNVYVSVVLARGRTGADDRSRPILRMGVANLEVDANAKRLAVQVTTDKPSYRPGETVKARVQVRAADGSGVPAEVSLAASDEGVLQLIGFKTPDPQAAFYAAVGLGVDSSTNWMRVHRDNGPGSDEDSEGGDSGDSSGHMRSKFLSTAFWAPALVTGADGTAEVSFTAPDNLTAFRVMAVAADAGDRFGSGDVRMTVAKPLSAVPALPRFLTLGDDARAGVLVHNNTGRAGQAVVTAEAADGVSLAGERKVTLHVPANGAVAALFALHAARVGSAKLTFHAQLGDEKDAVQVALPVEQPSGDDVQLLGEGELTAAKELALMRPKDALPGVGGLEVTVDST